MDGTNYTPLPRMIGSDNKGLSDSLNKTAPVKPSKMPLSILLGTILGVVVLGVVVGFVSKKQTLQNKAAETFISDQACIIKGGKPTDGNQCPNGKGSLGVIAVGTVDGGSNTSVGGGSLTGNSGDGMSTGGSSVGTTGPRVCCPDDGGPPPPTDTPIPVKTPPVATPPESTKTPPKLTETPPVTPNACFIPEPVLTIECPDGCQ